MSSFGARPQRTIQQISKAVLNAAMRVHTALGPGLLESAYEACLAEELRVSGLHVETQVPVPVVYKGVQLDAGYRIDLLVDGRVVVEVKSVETFAPVHKAQTLTYLRLSGKSLALLINFNVVHLKEGIKRFVMGDGWR